MKKINRRDYLLQMGAGVVGVMGSAPLDILAESQQSSAQEQSSERTRDLLWKATPSFPVNPRVTVIFGGLFGFFYNPDTGNCEIGSHRGHGKHRLMIEVWEKIAGNCKRLYSTEKGTLPKPNKKLKIEIVGRSASDVNCYQVGAYDRKQLKERDFRWLPDLDSDDFYPENYPKRSAQFEVKSILRHGTLYTYQRTSSTFTRVNPPDHKPTDPVNHKDLYHAPQYMAAAIQPLQHEDVSLKIDSYAAVVLPKEPEFIYQIIILNHCYENENSYKKCSFSPDAELEKERNDFHHVREVLQLPADREKYGLKLKNDLSSSPTFCPGYLKESTDEAPCMGAAFGKTGRMP